MKKSQSLIADREKAFFHWLSSQVTDKQLSDLYMALPSINEYGRKRNRFDQSLFEITEYDKAMQFRNMIKEDKRFQFVHYGQTRKIMLLLDKFCEFLSKGNPVSQDEDLDSAKTDKQSSEQAVERQEIDDGEGSPEKVTDTVLHRVATLRTVNGESFAGRSPAEALALLCDKLAQAHPAIMSKLVGLQYAGHGSVVLHSEEPSQGGACLKSIKCYIDKGLGPEAVVNYGKWLCKMCGEKDIPDYVSISEKKRKTVSEVSEKESKGESVAEPVVQEVDTPEAKSEEQGSFDSRGSKQKTESTEQKPSRGWSKVEVALLIEAYLNAMMSGNLKAVAERLSQTLRDLARKNGKSIDDTYRNVNGITMQLGTVQYCFTDGRNGLSNASSLVREMVDLYKRQPSEFRKILDEAHRLLKTPESEIVSFLVDEDYSLLKEELIKQGITTVEQLRELDLWSFMNRFGLYSISKRQEICNCVKSLLKDKSDDDAGKAYCLKTKEGNCFYGNSPAETLMLFCQALSNKYPLKLRTLVGQSYNGVGMVVLRAQMPKGSCVELSNPRAYIDGCLDEDTAKAYGIWICQKCGEKDEPVSVVALRTTEEESVEEEKQTKDVSLPETKQQSEDAQQTVELKDEMPVSQAEGKALSGKTGDAWLFKMLSVQGIKYDDKRSSKGCLWISGGHELDQFIKLCAEKGFKFYYKEDGYKAFDKGPAWWTKDNGSQKEMDAEQLGKPEDSGEQKNDDDQPSTASFRKWLDVHFRGFLTSIKHLAPRTVSQYCQSIEAVEQYLMKHHPSLTLEGVAAKQAKEIQKKLSYDWEYVQWNLKGHHQYSAALAQYIEFLRSGYREKESVTVNQPLREVVIGVLTEAGRPMTIAAIYADERVGEENGLALYGLLGQSRQEEIITEQASLAEEPRKEELESVQTDTSPVSDYISRQTEELVLGADLDGMTIEALAVKLDHSVAATRRIVDKNNNIVDICGKLIHKNAFVDWEQAADQLESILKKLMDKNNGYVSRAQLFEFARADMQMFMNDNDMEDAQKIYDMAEHLFAKEKYHGVEYVFSNMQHVAKPQTGMSSVLDVIINYAREQGGFFNEDELNGYLESVKIKTGNLRNGIMHVYDKPTFLFYAYHVLVLSECLGIGKQWLSDVKAALDRLFEDMGDHVVLRDIQPFWYAQLPSLPGDRPWTGILLQSVLLHYGKKLGGAKTIYAYQGLSGDYLQSMLVSADSEVQSFNDAVIATLVENGIEQREFESEELRQILVDRGLIDYLPVNPEGVVYPATLVDSFKVPPALVTVMLANNEVGSIQPIRELADIAHRFGSLMHTDAVQAVGHIPIDVNQLGVDMLSASAHKFNGPKGVGFLYIRKGVELEPLMHGGGQEKQMRSGTENVAGIVGMAAALEEHVQHLEEETAYLNDLRLAFVSALGDTGLDYRLNGAENRIPGSVSVSFRDVDGEMLLHRLDLMGTAVSTGSACDSRNTVLSHVLQAMKLLAEYAYGTIRITLGMDNTQEDVIRIAQQLVKIIKG